MNNANLKRIPASEVNREARQMFRKNFKEIVVLNIIPILMRIVGMYFMMKLYNAWLSGLGISLADPQAASQRLTEITQEVMSNPASATDYAFKTTPETNIIIFAGGLFFFLVCVGIGYALLDKYRNKDYQIRTIADQLQVFSGRFFFAVIFLAILFNIIVEAGLALYLIPGIWFILMFGQCFYIYKDDTAKNERIGLGKTFSAFARSSLLVRGYKWTLLLIFVEFLVLEIINLFTWEILSIVVHPYEQSVLAVFYEKVSLAKAEVAGK